MESRQMRSEEGRRHRGPNWLAVALVAAAVIGALLLWRNYQEKREQEAALGAMVTAFQKQNSLSVFRAQVPTFVHNKEERLFGLLTAEQVGVIPATIEYRLDLSKLEPDSFDWDADAQTMQVTIPPLTITEPALDARRAQLVNRGILVSGNAAMNLMRKNMGTARQTAIRESRSPEMVALARSAAREMMTQNVTLPLRAAGFENARVTVRFADEASADDEPSYIDRSNTYNQAIEEARRQRAAEGQR
jgi:hypothetical protein